MSTIWSETGLERHGTQQRVASNTAASLPFSERKNYSARSKHHNNNTTQCHKVYNKMSEVPVESEYGK